VSNPSFSTRHIEYLEKYFLDTLGDKISAYNLKTSELKETRFLRIDAISSFWELYKEKVVSLRSFMEDIISGFYEENIPLIFAILGKADKTEILIGTYVDNNHPQNNLETIKTSLKSSFQGIEVSEQEPRYLAANIENFNFACLVTGTPTEKVGTEKVGVEQIERIIRGLYGREWGYMVIANPAKSVEINSLYNSALNEMRVVADSQRSSGMESAIGKKYTDLLKSFVNKMQLAKAQGMWHAAVYLFSKDHETLNQARAIAKSVFGGRKSLPDRIRTLELDRKIDTPALLLNQPPASPGQFSYPYSYMSTICSADLANFVHIPSQEMPGFKIKPYARFNVSANTGKGKNIEIGEVLDQGEKMGISYKIPLQNLQKHGLIVGTTGSGKTNTLFYILKEVWKYKTPFLVIEPAKTEYRKLLLSEMGKDLMVFTLGNNNVSPFRINPFEIMPGVTVQSHIDLLKSVFNASFFMWGPLPHVLERCIHEIYTDKGWDLSTNQNSRGIHQNANPTLTDLYNKIDEVVNSLGYSKETTMEISSALKTRINSLRLGGKGLMLDTRTSIPFDDILGKPSILELEPIGDDEEKAFMMGLILTRMYEYYCAKGVFEGKELGHITIIEEAHRLLSNAQAENPYVANVKGKAVETFMNILSEIRAYGEGFMIAEQIPTKLASDVVKNTNLKVMHRVVAEDDRRVMGAAMNIEERETKKVVSMNVGEAAVFSEGDDGAYHLKIPYSKIETKAGASKDNDMVRQAMENFRENEAYFAPYGDCLKYCKSICRYKDTGELVSSNYRFSSQMSTVVLSLVDYAGTKQPLLQMLEMGKDEGDHAKDSRGIRLCSIINCAERYFERIGNQYYLPYEDTENLKSAFLEFYVDALDNYLRSGAEFLPENLNQPKMVKFHNLYRKLCEGKQPTSFCSSICPDNLCVYRFNMSEALKDGYYNKTFVEKINQGGENMWKNLASLCREAAEEIVLPGANNQSIKKIALCFALQKSHSIRNFTRGHIETIIKNLQNQIK
jgi:hypothetical protein